MKEMRKKVLRVCTTHRDFFVYSLNFSNLSKKRLDLFLHHRDGFGSELNYYVIQNNHNLLPF